jgi:PAS domain S-box-containing protein
MEEMHATQEELARQLEESNVLKERVDRRQQLMALTTILSETDLFGTITYVNEKFCEVSKYTHDELIGKPQNIVRHPDMPKELFKFFWATIKQGEVFRGILKNSTKDGGHYWVEATIVPIKNNEGKIIKYTGSRYHLEDEELAVKLYNKQADHFGWPRLEQELSTQPALDSLFQ